MDRILTRELDAIRRDNKSGAAQLALRAVRAVRAWARMAAPLEPQDLLWLARGLLWTRSEMAPFIRLANLAASASDALIPGDRLVSGCNQFERLILHSPNRIGRLFRQEAGKGRKLTVVTHSFSSTVVNALVRARHRVSAVCCGESRPDYEGRETARRLAARGMDVYVTTDLALAGWIEKVRDARTVVVSGADCIDPRGFINKGGTEMLFSRAREQRIPFWVLADTTKFIPLARNMLVHGGPQREKRIWKGWPRRVKYCDLMFSTTPLKAPAQVLSERGWMTPARVRREIAKIKLSPRLKELLD